MAGPLPRAGDGVRVAGALRAIVAVVGRPNVGKSTLFNRLVGRRRAIVHGRPGVTRDRVVETVELGDALIVDLIDTGGLLPEGEDELGLNAQVLFAIEESDVVIFVVDGKSGPLTGDEEIAARLRRRAKSVVLAVNKADTKAAAVNVHEFHHLGFEPLLVSAEHGLGMEALREAVVASLPEEAAAAEVTGPAAPRVAILGRPNVGKSSLLNRLLGSERVLVSERAGTTRDPVDTTILWEERRFDFVDTAGIRRRSRAAEAPEELAVMMAHRQITQADVGLLVVDASQSVTKGDLAIGGAIWEEGRAVVVACNKWDLVDEERRRRFERDWLRLSEILARPSRVNVSALSGRGVERILPRVTAALERFYHEVETSRLNRLLRQAVAQHQVPTVEGRPWKLLYASQVATGPPTFLLFANRTLPRQSGFRRYLENTLRRELELDGVPIRLVIRRRERRG